MIYLFNDMLLCGFEVISCVIFFQSFGIMKKKSCFAKILHFCMTTLLIYANACFFSQYILLKQVMCIIVLNISMFLYFEMKLGKSLVLAVMYQGVVLLVDFFVYILLYSNLNSFSTESGEIVGRFLTLFGKIVLFFCAVVIHFVFYRRTKRDLKNVKLVQIIIFPAYSAVTIYFIIINFGNIENTSQAITLYIIAFALVGVNLVAFYIMNDIVKRNAEQNEKKILEIQIQEQAQKYQYISEGLEKQRAKSHEFKNHIQCIEALLKNKEYGTLEQYVDKLETGFAGEGNIIHTNHPIVDAILNTKYAEALEKNILFVISVANIIDSSIFQEDIVVLLSNLLNNAIEACEKCNHSRIIKLKLSMDEDNFIVSVKNSMEKAVDYGGGMLKTTKEVDKEEHGFGTVNIIKIIEKYQGNYVITQENGIFSFSIIMPLQ